MAKLRALLATPLLIGAIGCAQIPGQWQHAGRGTGIAGAKVAMARIYERQGGSEKAREIYSRVIRENPNHGEAYHRLAILAAKKGDYQQAENLFRQAYTLAPRDVRLLNDIGYTYYIQHRFNQAEMALREALALDPTNERVQVNLGLALGQQGRFDQSLEMFRRAGSQGEALANLAFVHAQRGHHGKAEQLYSQALSIDSELKPAAEALVQLARRKRHVHQSQAVAMPSVPADAIGSPHESTKPAEATGVRQVGYDSPGPRNWPATDK